MTELEDFLKRVPSCDADLLALLEREEMFFARSLNRAAAASEEQKAAWRSETVFERRLRVSREVYDLLGGTIAHGPLKGVRLPHTPWWGAPDRASMLLGLYEREVLEVLTGEMGKNRSVFIDIGAADGYYAVGLTKKKYFGEAYCFEATEEGRKTISENARQNGVEDIIHSFGIADSLFYNAIPKEDLDQAIILVDVEGAEFDILSGECLESISNSIVIVEIHNWIENFSRKYYQFLYWAHRYFEISFLQPKPRDLTGFTELDDFTDDNRYLICSEGRPNVMRFLLLRPKN